MFYKSYFKTTRQFDCVIITFIIIKVASNKIIQNWHQIYFAIYITDFLNLIEKLKHNLYRLMFNKINWNKLYLWQLFNNVTTNKDWFRADKPSANKSSCQQKVCVVQNSRGFMATSRPLNLVGSRSLVAVFGCG